MVLLRSFPTDFDIRWLINAGLSEKDADKFKISFLEATRQSGQLDQKKISALTTLVKQLLDGQINIDKAVVDGLKEGTFSCPSNDCVFGLLEAALGAIVGSVCSCVCSSESGYLSEVHTQTRWDVACRSS